MNNSETVKLSVLIPCAGSGKRMKSDQNKMLMSLEGKTVLERTILAFQGLQEVVQVILIMREQDQKDIEKIIAEVEGHLWNCSIPIQMVIGGKERQDSVQKGLVAVRADATHVMIHDGARPFVTKESLLANIAVLKKGESACTGVPSKDTLKIVREDGTVLETPDRSKYWNVQTPQSFDKNLLQRAYAHAAAEGFQGTDDASLVEFLGEEVKMVMGSYDNIKVTTLEDLAFGKAILEFRKTQALEMEGKS